ncbi:methyltransferase family protein [Arcobacter sp.]|uniref:methyltransferase family protein n=1 Tax=Arcobacter sp. TaxID=1872629 RepID=UPI003D0BA178
MNDKIYSKVLVSMQFIIIVVLLFINDFIFNHLISLFISAFGFLFGIYTLYFNRIGNFNITPEIRENSKLIKNGTYKYIRYPMYLSVFLMMGGVVLTNINVINILCYISLIIVLYLKASKEEKLWSGKLEEYKQYKEHTKMFIPFIL